MASNSQVDGVLQQLRERWSAYMRCSSTEKPQEKRKHLELFMVAFLQAYRAAKGDLNKISSFGDIYSVSNMLTSEFQSAILLKCQDETEQSLVDFLCHGQGLLLLLQMLCILGSKVAGSRLDLSNLLVSLLPVVLKVPLQEYDPLYGLDLIFADFEELWWDAKSTSRHNSIVKDMILLSSQDPVDLNLNSSHLQKPGHEIDNELLKPADDEIERDDHPLNFSFSVKDKSESPSTTEESDTFTSLTSVTDIDSILSTNASECSDAEICSSQTNGAKPPSNNPLKQVVERKEDNTVYSSLAAEHVTRSDCSINNFQLSLLLVSTLENLICQSSSSLQDSDLLLHSSGQLIDILYTLSDAKAHSGEVLCKWDPAAAIAVQLVLLRAVFAILYTACRNPKAAKQLSKTSYVQKLLEVISGGCLDKEFLTTLQHIEIAKLVTEAGDHGRDLESKLSCCDLWRTFQQELLLGCFLQGLLLFVMTCIHYGTLINSTLFVLCHEIFEQFSSNGGFEFVAILLLKLDEVYSPEVSTDSKDGQLDRQLTSSSSYARKMEQYPRNLANRMVRNLGRMISMLKKGKSCCKSSRDVVVRKSSVVSCGWPVVQEDDFEMGVVYPPSSEVEESSESAADMEYEKAKQDQFPEDLCTVCRPAVTLLTVVKEIKNPKLRMSILTCLEKVGICRCVSPDVLVTTLLNKFVDQSKDLQGVTLSLINQLVLTEIDRMDDDVEVLQSQTFHSKRASRFRSKSAKQSPGRSDSGFSASDFSATALRGHVRDVNKDGKPLWTCLSQYCALVCYKDTLVAVEVVKALKPLATLGSKHLKGELFRMVILPCMLRCEGVFTEDVAEPLRKIRARSWSGSFRPEWQEKRVTSLRGNTLSLFGGDAINPLHSEQAHTEDGVCREVLEHCILLLPSLLTCVESRELFLNCGGLNELQCFLALPQLQEPVLNVLEFLANVENQEASGRLLQAEGGYLSTGSPETSSEERSDSKVCCKSFLLLLQYTTFFVETTNEGDDKTQQVPQVVPCHPVESSLMVNVWRTCLQLLVSNELFCELFLQDDGIVYSYHLLHRLFEVFQGHVSSVEDEDIQFWKDLVGLFESVLPVCMRMAHIESWQNKEKLPSLEQLVDEAKKTFSPSGILRKFLGKGISDCFLKASMWQLDGIVNSGQLNAEMKQQRDTILRRGSNGDSQEEWSHPLEDDDDDDETDGNEKGGNLILEEGYDADQEEGDSDKSDETELKLVKNKKQPKQRRQNGYSKQLQIRKGLVIYPQISTILLQLLKVCYGRRLCAGDPDCLVVVLHAVENLLFLLRDCEENCNRLCQHGLIEILLECFHDVMTMHDQALKGLQSLVVDVFVCLASNSISAAELWMFLTLFNSPEPPVPLLSAALSEVASKASTNCGPAFVMSFPCYAKGVDRRASAVTSSKVVSGKWKQMKGKRSIKIKSHSPQGSDRNVSTDEDSVQSGSSPSTSRLAVSESPNRQPKSIHRKSKSSMVGAQRRGSSKRTTRRQSGSTNFAACNSAEYELSEIENYEGRMNLPSPFLVWAIQLPFHGSLPRSDRGFSLAMWICLTCPDLGNEFEGGLKHVGSNSPGQLGKTGDRMTLSRRERLVHLCSLGSGKSLFELWTAPTDESLLVRWTKNHKGSSFPLVVLKERTIKVPALTRGQWHHLVISFTQPKLSAEEQRNMDEDKLPSSKLLIVVDGTESTVHDFDPPLPWHEEAKFTLSTLLLGHVTSSDSTKSPSMKASFHGGYQIGNVFVFAEKSFKSSKHVKTASSPCSHWLVEKEEAFYLHSLGPNSASMGQLSKDFNLLPAQTSDGATQPFLEAASLWSRVAITEEAVAANLPPGFLTSPHVIVPDLEYSLKKRLAAVYSPAFPLMFHQYAELLTNEDRPGRPASTAEQKMRQRDHEPREVAVKITSEVEPRRRHTLLESGHDVGGISVFIYLFAKVVEQTKNEKTQADTLSVVLSLQYSSAFHARAMAEESGFALLKRILLSPECRIGYHTLKVLMEAACDGDVFKPTHLADDPIMLNIDSTAVVRNVAIFQHFLLNWKIWEKAKQGVLEMLLATIDILVHGSHCYYTFNIIQFQKAQLVQQILIGCQERQSEGCKEIPRVISSLYVNIIQNIMGNPPDLTVLKAVCEFLIAVHPTDDITRLHAPSRCYLREHSLDFVQVSNRSSPIVRRVIPSPRTAPVRSIHSANPFQFTNPAKNTMKNTMSRSLSFESLGKKDLSKTRANVVSDMQNVMHQGRLTKTSSLSVTELSRSLSTGLDPSLPQFGKFLEKRKAATEERDVLQSSGSTEAAGGSHEFLPKDPFTVPGGDRNLSVTIPSRRGSEGLSSSALVLHESHFWEADSRNSPSPVRSPGTPLGMSYPGVCSIPCSKPVVIRRYESTPSRESQSSVDLMEYDMISESDFSSLRSSVANPSSTDDYLVVEGFPGIQSSTVTYCPTRSDSCTQGVDAMLKLRLGLMKLLEMKLFNLPSEHVPAVIGEVLKAEYMLVWAYHDADNVREFAIRILFQYLQKAEPKRFDQFLRIHGFHLLANQLYDHAVTKLLIEGCLSLLVDRQVDLKKDYDYSSADDRDLASSVRPMGVVPLLALLENSLLKPSLFHLLIQHLCQLFIKVDDLCLQAVDHGLLETLCNVIYGLCTLQHKQRLTNGSFGIFSVDTIMEDLQQFIVCIVRKACSTNGNLYFQMFEDLLIALENLEEQDHKKRDHDPSTSYCARYFRLFSVQVALHFFQEVSKGEGSVGGKKTKPSGLRLPFRGPDNSPDPVPAFTPVSSWVNLDRDQFKSCLDPSQLKKSPTSANSNEQTRRFQITCQLAVNSIVYCKTFFLPEDFVPFHFPFIDMDVHESLRPGMVRVTGAAIEKEFAQFAFSLLLEILDACLDGRKREIYKLFIVSKDSLKAQVGKLLVFLLNPNRDLDLSCFALNLVHHPRAKKIIETILTSSGGPKLRERTAVYLLKILAHPGLTQEQKTTCEKFKAMMLSLNLQSMRLNAGDSKITNDEEMQLWDSADKAGMMQWQKQRSDAYRRLDKRTEDLSEAISSVAKDVTRVVVEIQDTKRQALLKHTRDALSAEVQIRKKWRQLIERLIHERSVWYDAEHFPSSWRLDPTEGPGRVRCRLQRYHLDVDEKYLMEEYRGKKSKGKGTPLSYLFEDTTTSSKKNVYYIFDTPDTIRFLHHCKNITLDNKIKGVLLIGESHMYFVGEEAIADTDITQILLGNKDAISISWSYEEIQEIRTRRHSLQDNALEIFLTTGRTYLLAFDTRQDREIVLEQFKQRNLPCYEAPQQECLMALTQRWRSGQMTNFQYLTELNKMAGRSFNDLMQYPVFPFVLADFGHEVLDLTDDNSFRDLSRPIAVQNQSKERKYKENFRWLQEEYKRANEEDPMSAPYHYGCHYSNSGTVLHFLVRLPPFTKMFLQYQDRSFDIPDRTFHSMATTWRLSSFESATDVKELIPEFFFLPEFLENNEGFDFGLRQNGQRVMDVKVPQWAKGSTRLFILIHRQALESDYVSQFLNQWIDLVFGYKQRGQEAENAINVFHPATYYGVDVNAITDPVRQKALKTMIETYGQTPQQLFTYRHSSRQQRKPQPLLPGEGSSLVSLNTRKFIDADPYSGVPLNRLTTSFSSDSGTIVGSTADTLTEISSPVNTVEGLRWGEYVGSPALGAPAVGFSQTLNTTVRSLVCLKNGNVFVLSHNSTLMTVHQARPGQSEERLLWSAVLSWGYMDGCIRVCTSPDSTPVCLMEHYTPDKITCCAVTDGCKSLFIGTSTGTLSVLPVKYNPTTEPGIEVLGSRVRLHGHKDSITCIELCQAFSIVVSGSCDTTAIIWDLNRLSYVKYLEHFNKVSAVSISRTTGDIVTVSHTMSYISEESTVEEGSVMKMWTVNGKFIGQVTCEHMINCLEFSAAPEGISVNVIATGLSNGAIRLWSTWDLSHIRDIAPDQHLYQVASLTFSEDSQRLFAVNTHGKLVVWQRRDQVYTKPPLITVFQRG